MRGRRWRRVASETASLVFFVSPRRYDKSIGLYERAYAGNNVTLRKDHPTTRARRQFYPHMLPSQEQDPLDVSPHMPRCDVGRQTSKGSRLSCGLVSTLR